MSFRARKPSRQTTKTSLCIYFINVEEHWVAQSELAQEKSRLEISVIHSLEKLTKVQTLA